MDARWTKKNNNVFYGYKNHVKADSKTKLIEEFIVTDASVHDSQAIEQLLTEKDTGQPLYVTIGIARAKAKIGMIHPVK